MFHTLSCVCVWGGYYIIGLIINLSWKLGLNTLSNILIFFLWGGIPTILLDSIRKETVCWSLGPAALWFKPRREAARDGEIQSEYLATEPAYVKIWKKVQL